MNVLSREAVNEITRSFSPFVDQGIAILASTGKKAGGKLLTI